MSVVEPIDRRKAQRFHAAFDVRFSVNGGPEVLSDTLNFTSRSLAIRSDAAVQTGDVVDVRFGGLPDIKGEVVRVFPEGFAVVLSNASLEMMTRGHAPATEAQTDHDMGLSVTSPFIRVASSFPARALISSGLDFEPGYNRHFLSIITADPAMLENINTVWIGAHGTRWVASALRFERRNNRGVAVMALNDWQTHMGAAYGLKLSIISEEMSEWTVEIAADPIAAHLETLHPEQFAVNA